MFRLDSDADSVKLTRGVTLESEGRQDPPIKGLMDAFQLQENATKQKTQSFRLLSLHVFSAGR